MTEVFWQPIPQSSPTINLLGDLDVSSGTLNLSGGTGNSTLNLKGNFNQTGGAITETSSGYSTIIFNNSSTSQTITRSGGTFTGTNHLTIDNSNGVSLASNVAYPSNGTSALTILTLTNGNLNIGSRTLTLNCHAISVGSGSLVGGATSNLTVGGNSANALTIPECYPSEFQNKPY
ncbi:MAG: hypothetical protein MZU79_02245 [Anaerotruncus sp.]|nr:hypothetical protein [Anaerotruncus sp.]